MPFSSVVGHKRLTTLISRAIERGTLPPTLLFAGPPGVGKWVVAQATAQAVNCLSPIKTAALAIDACGQCRACDRIARGVHVDVMAVEPDEKASIKTDVIRDVLSQTGYRPFEGKQRFVLIREAEALEQQAQNALLKNLEEPPPGTVFILTTAVPGALLPTVRSRCMRLRFGRLTAAEVTQALVRDHDHNEKLARDMAPLSDGSIGQALALSDNDLSALRDTAMRWLQQMSGRAEMQSRLNAAANMVGALSKKEERSDLVAILRLAASMLRDMEAINAGADARVLANPAVADDLSSLARAYAGERARMAFAAIDRVLAVFDRNPGTKVIAEWLSAQM